ncbi:MAG TPA: LysR substrate-binding domain-containing protein [Mesorhizobium sp.]|uniref:LysR substrate-binding domain-containing protein n=1 Tax=Mesorhizobium sp. TaxID=1871066 RepID=UPI002DDD9263|nr:LysR substrate-binding domain-containing protein [Mesorhizobium sp.]HEV2503989.1 LysR substrate-binding domain-containing protein [Mesorhizobium sp.]
MVALNRIPLNGLRAIEVAGRLGSLAKAAEEMGISVGAVSQHVIRTEKLFGRPVFERTPRGLSPTPFGARMLASLEPAFRSIAQALDQAGATDRTVLAVTTTPVFATRWLVPRLSAFQRKRPEIQVRIETGLTLTDLDRSDLDVALRMGRGKWPGTSAELLLRQRIFPVCAPALASNLRTPADLKSAPVIRYPAMENWTDWLAPHGMVEADLPQGLSFSDASLSLEAATAGLGVMIAWQAIAADALADGRLVKPFEWEVETGIDLWFVASAAHANDAKIVAFKRWLKSELAGQER